MCETMQKAVPPTGVPGPLRNLDQRVQDLVERVAQIHADRENMYHACSAGDLHRIADEALDGAHRCYHRVLREIFEHDPELLSNIIESVATEGMAEKMEDAGSDTKAEMQMLESVFLACGLVRWKCVEIAGRQTHHFAMVRDDGIDEDGETGSEDNIHVVYVNSSYYHGERGTNTWEEGRKSWHDGLFVAAKSMYDCDY